MLEANEIETIAAPMVYAHISKTDNLHNRESGDSFLPRVAK